MFPLGLNVMGWNLSLAAPAMLWGLAGVAIPVLIHFLNRRRATVFDWGAMQFLMAGRRARRRFRITEILLMLGRMAILALVALAIMRPILSPGAAARDGSQPTGRAAPNEPRDVVIVLDASESMARIGGGTTPRIASVKWARDFVSRLPTGSTVALLDASVTVRPLVVPASADRSQALAALEHPPPPRGSCDLRAAIGEALSHFAKSRNPVREVFVLTDSQRAAWKVGEHAQWALLKEIVASNFPDAALVPQIAVLDFAVPTMATEADGIVASLRVGRRRVAIGAPVHIDVSILNAGPAQLERDVELLVDGVVRSQTRRHVGPLAAGSATGLSFEATLTTAGPHVVKVRLSSGDDPLDANDASETTIDVIERVSMLIVDGDADSIADTPSTQFFLRAALAPSGETGGGVRVATVPLHDFNVKNARGYRVVVLSNIARLSEAHEAAIQAVLDAGCGVLVIPGSRCERSYYSSDTAGRWLPARLGEHKDYDLSQPQDRVPRPLASSFGGPVLQTFADGAPPALASAKISEWFALEPHRSTRIDARLNTGDAWVVERPVRRGRVAMLASGLDSRSGTLVVNPDFVPLLHDLILHLSALPNRAPLVTPGTSLEIELSSPPPSSISVASPTGLGRKLEPLEDGGRMVVRFSDTEESGVYRFSATQSGAPLAMAYAAADPTERNPEPLDPGDRRFLEHGWALDFEEGNLDASRHFMAAGGASSHALWRWLVAFALTGLCFEVVATRRMALRRGMPDRD